MICLRMYDTVLKFNGNLTIICDTLFQRKGCCSDSLMPKEQSCARVRNKDLTESANRAGKVSGTQGRDKGVGIDKYPVPTSARAQEWCPSTTLGNSVRAHILLGHRNKAMFRLMRVPRSEHGAPSLNGSPRSHLVPEQGA